MSPVALQRRSVAGPGRARRGLTLMELMLVLALLVIVSAIVVVAFTGTLANQQLRKAGDQVRSQMGKARVRAMKSGSAHALWVEPNGAVYRIEPWITGEEVTEGSGSLVGVAPAADSNLLISQATLPEGVVFYVAETLEDSRSALAQMNGGSLSGEQGSMPPILFYPDGTSSTARLTLTNNNGLYVVISLRGLTGTASATDTLSQEELAYQ
jgi:prepilin-type N-terminal cleavage/methylation domain-containing protein